MAYPQGQTSNMNRKLYCISTEFLLKCFTELLHKHKLQVKPYSFTTATELTAAPLYCFTLLLNITLLSSVCQVTLLYSHPRVFG